MLCLGHEDLLSPPSHRVTLVSPAKRKPIRRIITAAMSVHALAKSKDHTFSKVSVPAVKLLAGLGVDGDCHAGKLVQHQASTPAGGSSKSGSAASGSGSSRPINLRQVHLIPIEILDGVSIQPGQIGENITTAGLDLFSLGRGDRLHFYSPAAKHASDAHAVVVVTGLREPGPKLERFRAGLKECFTFRDDDGKVLGWTAGIMGTVETGGTVQVGMNIVVEQAKKYKALKCV